jgi:hypothetical protein
MQPAPNLVPAVSRVEELALMALLDSSLDEYTGDGFGDGLADSSTGYSSDPFDEMDPVGSSLQLDYTDGLTDLGTFDAPEGIDDFNLSGATDPAPDWFESDGVSENGSGYASSSHVLSASRSGTDNLSNLFSAFGKFGSSIGSLLIHSPAQAPYNVSAGASPNGNPNLKRVTGITSSHAALVLLVIGGLIFVLVVGGE